MPETSRTDFLEVLRILISRGVEFIVVGGVSAVLQGAPISTFDLDVVHSTDRKNIEALLAGRFLLGTYYPPSCSLAVTGRLTLEKLPSFRIGTELLLGGSV